MRQHLHLLHELLRESAAVTRLLYHLDHERGYLLDLAAIVLSGARQLLSHVGLVRAGSSSCFELADGLLHLQLLLGHLVEGARLTLRSTGYLLGVL